MRKEVRRLTWNEEDGDGLRSVTVEMASPPPNGTNYFRREVILEQAYLSTCSFVRLFVCQENYAKV